MASIPTQTKSFPTGNCWNISNGTTDVDLSPNRLFHAAVTAGHGRGWRQSIASDAAAQAELRWKASALQATVCERNTPSGFWRNPLVRLFPTERLAKMDQSERRALSYHLGITLAVAWARKSLGIPWLLHLDVYQDEFNINLQSGDSRPDLVGRDSNGAWAVFEAKGRSRAPDPDAETKAKQQSKRVVDIGGVAPSNCFAFFSYFSTDKSAVGRRKPKVVHLRVIDPKPESEGENEIRLPLLTTDRFFELYYRPWRELLINRAATKGEGAIVWHRLEDVDFRVGILADLKYLIALGLYDKIPESIHNFTSREGLSEQYLDWAGDGLIIEPGETWEKLWREK
jgi:hypothetical protein